MPKAAQEVSGKLADDVIDARLGDDYIIHVTLVVKGDTRDKAESHVARRLGAWFIEDLEHGAPYPQGSLLHWSVRRPGPQDPNA